MNALATDAESLSLLQILLLALVQGITEFLPISSSAHLILLPQLLGWPDQGLAMDVAVHVGTLAAVLWYFRRELKPLTRATLRAPLDWRQQGRLDAHARLGIGVALATIPVGLAGLLLHDTIATHLRAPLVIAAATIGFGLLLGLADRLGHGRRSEFDMGWGSMLLIGAAQALALIPGTSRSGITITAGLLLGMHAPGAARFSFLLAIPVIVLAGAFEALDLLESGLGTAATPLLLAAAVAALSAYLCMSLFVRLAEAIGMLPFVAYRLALGGLLIVVFA